MSATHTQHPQLAHVDVSPFVAHVKAGTFTASYVNWADTLNILREEAPGWMPEYSLEDLDHSVVKIRFVHLSDGVTTPWFPQAVMDNRNNAIPPERIDARDITDTHRRGVCAAAAAFFGLASTLWSKVDDPYQKPNAKESVAKKPWSPDEALEALAAKVKGPEDAETLHSAIAKAIEPEDRAAAWDWLKSSMSIIGLEYTSDHWVDKAQRSNGTRTTPGDVAETVAEISGLEEVI